MEYAIKNVTIGFVIRAAMFKLGFNLFTEDLEKGDFDDIKSQTSDYLKLIGINYKVTKKDILEQMIDD